MDNTEDVDTVQEDLKALKDVAFTLNDLICVVAYGGTIPELKVEYDEQGRPQVVVSMEE